MIYEYRADQPPTTGNIFLSIPVCDCNMTSCPHWQDYRGSYTVSAAEVEPPPRPRPWIVEQTPLVPAPKALHLAPWRPRQQRARDGI